MQGTVTLMDQGPLSGPLTPESLSGTHPAWADDVARLGPFTSLEHELVPGAFQRIWVVPSDDFNVFVAGSTESSMDVAWRLLEAERLPLWGAVLAVEQTSGRGQMRRAWQSPPGNLHLSLRLPDMTADDENGKLWERLLPLVLGYLLAKGLEEAGCPPLALKWPNDLVQDGRKVGGVLIEQRGKDVVAGVGLNLRYAPPEDRLRKNAAMPATLLAFSTDTPTPLGLCSGLVKNLKNYYVNLLETSTPGGFLPLVTRRILWMGRTVFWSDNRVPRQVRLLRLAPDGGLVVDQAGQEETIYSGSISPERPDTFSEMSPVNGGAD